MTSMEYPHPSYSPINESLLQMRLHASYQPGVEAAYISNPKLMPLLTSENSQVIYGRYGTGKTHLLIELSRLIRGNGGLTSIVNMRTLGSIVELFGSDSTDLPMRAHRLAVDVLGVLHAGLREQLFEDHLGSDAAECLDELGYAISTISVQGPTTLREQFGVENMTSSTSDRSLGASTKTFPLPELSGSIDRTKSESSTENQSTEISIVGDADIWMHLGRVREALSAISQQFGTIYVLIDEWTTVPLELRPYLADLLHRIAWNSAGCVVKLGTLEGVAHLRANTPAGLVGFEPGAGQTIHLDDYQGVETPAQRDLMVRIIGSRALDSVTSPDRREDLPDTPIEFCSEAFEPDALRTLIMASEGIPRVAMLLSIAAAELAGTARIGMVHVERALDRQSVERLAPIDGTAIGWFLINVVEPGVSRSFYVVPTGSIPTGLLSYYNAGLIHRDERSLSSRSGMVELWHLDYLFFQQLRGPSKSPIPKAEGFENNSGPKIGESDLSATRRLSGNDAFLDETRPPAWIMNRILEIDTPGFHIVVDLGRDVACHHLRSDNVTIGRSQGDIRIDRPAVSKLHARLIKSGSAWRIVDEHSTNGIWVRGFRREVLEIPLDTPVLLGDVVIYLTQVFPSPNENSAPVPPGLG